jgi:uncharacterized membrane protein
MAEEGRDEFDPRAEEHRTIGEGLFEQEMGPNSSMAHLYRGELHRMTRWREQLADGYREPTLKISYEEALAHRLRRIYLPMLGIVPVAWVIRTTVIAGEPWPGNAAVGAIPGPVVVGTVLAGFALAVAISFRPREWKGHPELRSREIGECQEE